MSAPDPRLLLLAALAAACSAPVRPLDWQQYGGMREVMREGRDEARIALAQLGPVRDAKRGDLVAVGALAGLAGEVTADGRDLWIATAPSETELVVESGAEGDAATLLTAARVETWHELDITGLTGATGLLDEPALAHRLAALGSAGEPTPIRVEGTATSLSIHVIRGDCPHAPDAVIPAWRWEATESTEVVLVGFYAPGAPGVLTHHGTDFHLHAVIRDATGRTLTGHVDAFTLVPGARVFLGSSR